MKARTLKLLAGLGSPLIVAGSASAGFVGLKNEFVQTPFGIDVMRVYAVFDNPGQDHLLAVAGIPGSPMRIRMLNSTFYQHAFGNDQAPNENLIAAFPSLAFDTFVSIGRLTQTGSDPDTTQLSKGWPGFPDTCLTGTSLGWSVSADDPQGAPVDGQVFIGQYSSTDFFGFAGWFLIKAISDGDPDFQVYVAACPLIPCRLGDVNSDKCVNIQDLLAVLALWGPSSTCAADFDGDGAVGITDLLIVLAEWDTICP